MHPATIPLFPLHTVLFPGGLLRLRIFEPRYLDMIGRCMREQSGFGVALILEGAEAGGPARTVAVGTLARIVDFERMADGLLGITARGAQRFRIVAARCQGDGLNLAEVRWLPAEAPAPLATEHAPLVDLLRQVREQMQFAVEDERYEDASWVGMRLAELLPLPAVERQELLELADAQERLGRLREGLKRIADSG